MSATKIRHIALKLLGLLVAIIACTPTVRHGVLNTIFDGVPPQPVAVELTVGIDTIGQIDTTRILALENARNIIRYDYHEPYQKKECASCHSEGHMGKLVAEEPELCYQCHDNDAQKHRFQHGPAGAGYCTSCHRPHMAEAENLLLDEGNNLCFDCHDNELVQENIIHQEIKEKTNCVDCHNPHSGENIFMLQAGACNSCHEEKINDYSFLHGPVSANYCSTCHESHASKNDHLLINTGQDLCLNCHEQTAIFMNQEHQGHEQENCIDCHNPHGGEDQFMLN
jgi:predicted CXXCH cytochrome family protein